MRETEKLKNQYQLDFEQLTKTEHEIIEKAKIQAREILLEAKEDANNMIRELEQQPNAKKSNQIRNTLNQKIDNLSSTKNSVPKQEKTLPKNDVKVGLTVKIPRLNQIGTIVSNLTKNNTVMVQIGSMKTSFKLEDLIEAKNKPQKQTTFSNAKREFKVSSISPEINVIGKNVEDACFVVDKYLDNCSLNGLQNVQIVHGKGTGILRRGIHNFLKNHPHVKSFRLGTFGEGEDGVTIVELK